MPLVIGLFAPYLPQRMYTFKSLFLPLAAAQPFFM